MNDTPEGRLLDAVDARALQLVADVPEEPPGQDLDLLPLPSREEMLDAVPLSLALSPAVDLDAEDPSYEEGAGEAAGRRRCIAERKAGGRCTVSAMHRAFTCAAHSGILDPSAGGRALAEKRRREGEDVEESARLARLGTRGVIAEELAQAPRQVAAVVRLLLANAEQGDLASAKLLLPYLNQGLGLPTERVQVTAPATAEDVRGMATGDLVALVASRRAARRENDAQSA